MYMILSKKITKGKIAGVWLKWQCLPSYNHEAPSSKSRTTKKKGNRSMAITRVAE
jgi:hypothetical protein